MEMLFLTALPSLLWPDGIRERPEAVKANTSKKEKEGRGVRATRELTGWAGKWRKKKMRKKQNRKK